MLLKFEVILIELIDGILVIFGWCILTILDQFVAESFASVSMISLCQFDYSFGYLDGLSCSLDLLNNGLAVFADILEELDHRWREFLSSIIFNFLDGFNFQGHDCIVCHLLEWWYKFRWFLSIWNDIGLLCLAILGKRIHRNVWRILL